MIFLTSFLTSFFWHHWCRHGVKDVKNGAYGVKWCQKWCQMMSKSTIDIIFDTIWHHKCCLKKRCLKKKVMFTFIKNLKSRNITFFRRHFLDSTFYIYFHKKNLHSWNIITRLLDNPIKSGPYNDRVTDYVTSDGVVKKFFYNLYIQNISCQLELFWNDSLVSH